MARAEKLDDGEAGHGAATLPVVDEAGPEEVSADTMDDEALGLGRPRQGCGFLPECREELVGPRTRELEGPAKKTMESGVVRDDPGEQRAIRKRAAEARAVLGESLSDVLPRECRREPRVSRATQPDSER